MNTTAQDTADQNPECPWKITKLCRQHRADQWSCRCYCGKMMPKQDLTIRLNVIMPISKLDRWSRYRIIEP
ncbi:hypothetical protein D3C72_1361040 [compost metagenome]